MRGAALAAVACAALAAGCGSDDDPEPASEPAATEITVELDPRGDLSDPEHRAAVSCPGDEATVCDAVAALPDDPGAPTDPQQPCTEIYGGPDALFVEGTLRGEPISAGFSRENGCAIERFDRFTPLLNVLFPGYTPGESLAP